MLLLGKLHVLSNAGDSTSHARKKGPKRARVTYNYAFDHREVCKKAFIFLHDISKKQFKNIAKHLKDNGPVPIVHGNTGKVPKTTYPYEVTCGVVQFVKSFAEIHGLPQPSARRGRADIPQCTYQHLITTRPFMIFMLSQSWKRMLHNALCSIDPSLIYGINVSLKFSS